MAEGFKGQEASAPGEGVDDLRVGVEDVEGGAGVFAGEKVAEDARGVVVGGFVLEHGTRGFEEVSSHLLRQHVVVAFPGYGREVVGVPGPDAGETGVAVAAAGSTADFETFGCSGAGKRFETAGSGVKVGEEVCAGVEFFGTGAASGCRGLAGVHGHLLLVFLVELHHSFAGEVEGEGGGEEREKTLLDHCVVHDLVLCLFGSWRITILELSAYTAVSYGDCNSSGQDTARLENDGGADIGQCAINQRRRGRS